MNALNPDLSYANMLSMSYSDIKSAIALYKSKNYPQSIYFLQQSIEKSCKYVGLTIKIFTEEKLKRIGHNPHAVFRRFFNSEEMKSLGGPRDFDKLEKLVEGLPLEERIKSIESLMTEIKEEKFLTYTNEDPLKVMVEYIKNNQFKHLFEFDIDEIIEAAFNAGVPKQILDDIAIKQMNKINNMSNAIHISLILSFLVWGIEEDIRYPSTNDSPLEKYNSESSFVTALPLFLNAQENSVLLIGEYYSE